MELSYKAARELLLLTGHVRVLAHLMEPVPHLPDVDRATLIKGLNLVADELERVAIKTEMGCCPFCNGGGGQP